MWPARTRPALARDARRQPDVTGDLLGVREALDVAELEHLGHRPVLSNPKQTKAIAAARLKNDRVDAERLALLLRGNLLPTVWIPSPALREARELVRHRIQLVWLRGVIRNRLQAMLARRNVQPTSGQSWLTQRGQHELQRLPLPETPSRIREDCGMLLPTLDAQIRRLDAGSSRAGAGIRGCSA